METREVNDQPKPPVQPVQQPLGAAQPPKAAPTTAVAAPAVAGPPALSQLAATKTKIETFLKAHEATIQAEVVGDLKSSRLIGLMIAEIDKNPQLANCTLDSFYLAAKRLAQAGLEPGPFGHAYLVPFQNKDKGCSEVVPILGWRGLSHVAYRSGAAKLIKPRLVFAGDTVEEWEDDQADHFRVIPNHAAKRDESTCIGAVCFVTLPCGLRSPFYMTKADILRRKAVSQSKGGQLWTLWWDEAYQKTVVRHATKFLDLSHLSPEERTKLGNAYAASSDEEVVNEADVASVRDASTGPTTTAGKAMARVMEVHPEIIEAKEGA